MNLSNSVILLLIFDCLFVRAHNNFQCVLNSRKIDLQIINHSPNARILQTGAFEKIRIHVDYSTLDSQAVEYGESYISNLKKVIEEAIKPLENLLSVQRLQEPLAINDCDSQITKISTEVSSGIESDIVVFPVIDASLSSNQNTDNFFSILAYASPCKLSGINYRPVAGIVSFSPNGIDTSYDNWMEFYSLITIHELIHIFVFNSSLYSYFIDSNGVRIPESKIYKTVLVNGKEKNMIISPKVVQEARKHFGCSSLEGLYLEDIEFVNNSEVSSHWENKYMLGDLMIGNTYQEYALSQMTLALFEDSGWYKVNYYSGGLFRFGLNAGCDFFSKACISNQKSNFKEYCDFPNDKICYYGRLAKGRCFLIENQTIIPQEFRYFKNPYYGGKQIADFCPVAGIFNNDYPNSYLGNSCIIGKKNTLPTFKDELIGEESGCFVSSLTQKENQEELEFYGKNMSVCYRYECNKSSERIIVSVGTLTIHCPTQGGEIQVEGYDGKFNCPAYMSICNQSVRCNSIHNCVDKQSETVIKEPSTLTPKILAEPDLIRTCYIYECADRRFTFFTNKVVTCPNPNEGCKYYELDSAIIICSQSDYDFCSLDFVCQNASNCVYMKYSAPNTSNGIINTINDTSQDTISDNQTSQALQSDNFTSNIQDGFDMSIVYLKFYSWINLLLYLILL